ncbi:hypothetical protein AVEN_191466-1 [Araneus ventricosus]|uniref:Uncharacterized protein n=1 Tax=Araneus ventricosus TaxID=182803 RepID=A0A4Y2UF22_ARAVE|nr:hypothetical protein AVEN_191466-1 [Araneus ventricosus]
MLPVSIFAMYYNLICHRLYTIVKNFATTPEQISTLNYAENLKQYLSIKKLIQESDSKLSLLMFTSCLYFACTMNFDVTTVIDPEDYGKEGGYLSVLSVWALSGVNFPAFIGTTTACLVYESSSSMQNRTKDLINPGENPTAYHQRFLSMAEKEMAMTV